MTLKQLMKALEGLDGDREIILHAYDPVADLHSYYECELENQTDDEVILHATQLSDRWHTPWEPEEVEP